MLPLTQPVSMMDTPMSEPPPDYSLPIVHMHASDASYLLQKVKCVFSPAAMAGLYQVTRGYSQHLKQHPEVMELVRAGIVKGPATTHREIHRRIANG